MFDIDELIARVAEYDALIIDADDLIEQDMNRGIIKIDKSVFDDFVENTVIYIYCPDINANSVMEFVIKTEDDDSITMEWLDSFSL